MASFHSILITLEQVAVHSRYRWADYPRLFDSVFFLEWIGPVILFVGFILIKTAPFNSIYKEMHLFRCNLRGKKETGPTFSDRGRKIDEERYLKLRKEYLFGRIGLRSGRNKIPRLLRKAEKIRDRRGEDFKRPWELDIMVLQALAADMYGDSDADLVMRKSASSLIEIGKLFGVIILGVFAFVGTIFSWPAIFYIPLAGASFFLSEKILLRQGSRPIRIMVHFVGWLCIVGLLYQTVLSLLLLLT